jgi:imidazolonepropionase-like amidohydrolase
LINIENFLGIADAASKYPVYAKHRRVLHARARETVSSAVEAGIPVYAGTDAGGGINHGQLAEEIIALTEVGLDPVTAIGAASWQARQWLGWPSLTEGAPADLVGYAADPRLDLAVLRDPARILLRGRVVR